MGGRSINHRALIWIAAGAILYMLRHLVWQIVWQLMMGALLSATALPIMRRLEKRLPSSVAALCSLLVLSAVLIGLIVLLLPSVLSQGKELLSLLPDALDRAEKLMEEGKNRLAQSGMILDAGLKTSLFQRFQEALSKGIPKIVSLVKSFAGSIGKWLAAPIFAFYFLKDRKVICDRLLSLVPMDKRQITVKSLREMKRESAGYLRGQILLSAVVGALTAVGLLLCGLPAWPALGVLMGFLEWIPYIGPLIGGGLVVLLSLGGSVSRTLWALGVVVAVQQAESAVLSPHLMSQATSLHPLAVILCILIGGSAAGVTGIFVAVPLLLCIRALIRVHYIYQGKEKAE